MKILSTFKKTRIINSLFIILILLLLSTCTMKDSNPFLRTSGSDAKKGSVVSTSSETTKISAAYGHTLILDENNTLWGTGDNDHGQLGIGDTTDRSTFVKMMSDVKDMKAGRGYTLILKNDNTLWATGYNGFGSLGVGDKVPSTPIDSNNFTSTPLEVTSDVKDISVGSYHSLILKNDDTLWATGFNDYGQLGVGDKILDAGAFTYTSTLLEVTSDVKMMRGGAHHTLILKNDDTLWGVGHNLFGQIGGNVPGGDINDYTPIPIEIASDVKKIRAGSFHSLFLKNNGTLWATGRNDIGQLGVGHNDTKVLSPVEVTSNVKEMKAGTHSLILKNDDTLWATGCNKYGQHGNGQSGAYETTPVEVASNIKDMAVGPEHTIILKNDDTLWVAGWNYFAQLGLGDTDDRDTFTQIILYDEQNIILNPVSRSWHYIHDGYTSTIDVPLQKSGEVRSVQLQSGYGAWNYITGLSIRTVEYANKDVSGDLNADPGIVEIERYRGNPGYGLPRTIGFDDYYYADKIVVVLYSSYNRATIVISEVTAKVRLY